MANSVKVIEKNTGKKIQWEQDGYYLSFDDGALAIKATKYQLDNENTVDICRNKQGNLVIGVPENGRYVAQVTIPAATYTTETTGEGEEATQTRTKDDLDMGDVTLTLWSIE